MATFTGLGLMSGTSLDGLDMCCVEFTGDIATDIWSYRILKTETVPYPTHLRNRLETSHCLSGLALSKLNVEYGHYLGQTVSAFIEREKLGDVQFVASHGHTVFHQPESKLTLQIGDGETLASHLNHQVVVTDFRYRDVALGGQGAPLVPAGEQHLFNIYPICLNLGGIASVSIHGKGFDICPCNMVLNYLAKQHTSKMDYDKDGQIASSGSLQEEIIEELNSLPFYLETPPKSLGYEWVSENILPSLDTQRYSVADLMMTSVQHITDQITRAVVQELHHGHGGHQTGQSAVPMLITGGGALNVFLVNMLKNKLSDAKLNIGIVECDHVLIEFKEALVFAFLGLRCLLGLPNTSAQVTGARTDCVAGSIHLPTNPERLHPKLSILSKCS